LAILAEHRRRRGTAVEAIADRQKNTSSPDDGQHAGTGAPGDFAPLHSITSSERIS